jgi:3-deoxy-D-manno-octulosonate 8-phosphate phosphatase (KDO 8-P phosphatase)
MPKPKDRRMIVAEGTRTKAQGIKLMAFDVDGVLSEGSLFYTDEGIELKAFNCLDGLCLHLLRQAGIKIAIITGRKTRCVEARMRSLGIDLLFQGIKDKLATMTELLEQQGLRPDEAGFMGDDIIDLKVMAACGFAAAPADAQDLAKQYADLISSKPGGRGAVREVCEFILDAQGKLDAALAPFLPGVGR